MDRRNFLKTTAVGGTAITLAPAMLVSCAAGEKKAAEVNPDVKLNISLQEGVAVGGTLQEKLDFMEQLGVTGFEPWGGELPERVDEISKALEGRNIKVSAICAGFDGFILAEDSKVKEQFDTTYRRILEAAGKLGSTGVIMVPAFNGQTPCKPHTLETRKFLTEELHKLGEFAVQCGTTVILEPLNREEAFFLRQVPDAAALCREADSEGVKCMGDFWHMQEETSDYAAFMAAGNEYLRHVHIASRGNRKMPGEDGAVDNYVEGFRALKEIGYPYYVSFECGSVGDKSATIPAAVELIRKQWEEA